MIDSLSRPRRMMSAAFLCAALVLFVLSAFAFAARAHAQAATRLEGQILNGTAGVSPERIANLDVTLFQMSSSGPVTRTVRTDVQGRFAFDDLNLNAQGGPLFAQVDYEGLHYFSDVLTPDVAASKPLTLTVYETQTLPADFQIEAAHFILDAGQRILSGGELLQVQNPTDRAFLLPLPLPLNATNVEFNDPRDQFRVVRNPDGSLLFPILPTTTQVLVGVQLTTPSPEYVLHISVPVRIARLNILVSQATGAQISSTQLIPGPPFAPQGGTSYAQLNGDDIAPNSTIAVSITNLPGADNSTMVRTVVLGAGGLAALALLSMALYKRRASASPDLSPEGREGLMEADGRLARLQAMAALDDAFEAGEIAEDEYLAQRTTLKAELMQNGREPNEVPGTQSDPGAALVSHPARNDLSPDDSNTEA